MIRLLEVLTGCSILGALILLFLYFVGDIEFGLHFLGVFVGIICGAATSHSVYLFMGDRR